jgi:hypothetical protein
MGDAKGCGARSAKGIRLEIRKAMRKLEAGRDARGDSFGEVR